MKYNRNLKNISTCIQSFDFQYVLRKYNVERNFSTNDGGKIQYIYMGKK